MRTVALLALAAVSMLAACKKDTATVVTKVASTADSADQVVWGLKTILTDRGVQRAELMADTGYFFDESTRAELRMVTTTFFNNQGARDGVLTSKRGTYNTRANVMEARDNVVIVGVDGKRLSSPMVRFEQYRNMIVSDSPFVLIEGERRLEGIGFDSDPQMLNVKVRKLSRASGASIILPAAKGSAPVFRTDSAGATAMPVPGAPPSAGVVPKKDSLAPSRKKVKQ